MRRVRPTSQDFDHPAGAVEVDFAWPQSVGGSMDHAVNTLQCRQEPGAGREIYTRTSAR